MPIEPGHLASISVLHICINRKISQPPTVAKSNTITSRFALRFKAGLNTGRCLSNGMPKKLLEVIDYHETIYDCQDRV